MKNIQTILLSIIPFFVYSQTHIIKLSNGIIVQGDIVEMTDSIKIKTTDGQKWTFDASLVESISKNGIQPNNIASKDVSNDKSNKLIFHRYKRRNSPNGRAGIMTEDGKIFFNKNRTWQEFLENNNCSEAADLVHGCRARNVWSVFMPILIGPILGLIVDVAMLSSAERKFNSSIGVWNRNCSDNVSWLPDGMKLDNVNNQQLENKAIHSK